MILSIYVETWILPLWWDRRPFLPLVKFQAEIDLEIVFIVACHAKLQSRTEWRSQEAQGGSEARTWPWQPL